MDRRPSGESAVTRSAWYLTASSFFIVTLYLQVERSRCLSDSATEETERGRFLAERGFFIGSMVGRSSASRREKKATEKVLANVTGRHKRCWRALFRWPTFPSCWPTNGLPWNQ